MSFKISHGLADKKDPYKLTVFFSSNEHQYKDLEDFLERYVNHYFIARFLDEGRAIYYQVEE